MRPERIELQGFTAFRQETVVDLTGADLFALVGPTGSGKSSLIDAVCFALYGSVPRLGQRDVAPVISLGALEARIRFDFSIGSDSYTVARVVRRTRTGATTAEARLEQAGRPLASGADEVSAAVERLLGLGFDHFTKSVVLPQGEFAAFLHDKPSDRQKLLRELLDLKVYERMRELANQRRVAAEAEQGPVQAQLAELAALTPEAQAEATVRLTALRGFRAQLDAAEPELERLQREAEQRAEEADQARQQLTRLGAIRQPPGLETLEGNRRQAEETCKGLAGALTELAGRLATAEQERTALPEVAELEQVAAAHRRLTEEEEEHRRLAEQVTAARQTSEQAATAESEAVAVLTEARLREEQLRRDHAAHDLAAGLEVGQPCPVCRQPVTERPDAAPPAVLGEAAVARAQAEEARSQAGEQVAAARQQLAAVQSRWEDASRRVEALAGSLHDRPELAVVEEQRRQVAEADERLAALRGEENATRRRLDGARQDRDEAVGRLADARSQFDRARDRVAALEPPVPDGEDLVEDWQALTRWSEATAAKLSEVAASAEQRAEEATKKATEQHEALQAAARQAGLDPEEGRLRDLCIAAVTAAEHRLAEIERGLARTESLRRRAGELGARAQLAKAFGRHLSATGFEAWLLEEALAALVAGANHLLDELSDGAYSLEIVRREFQVIDHRNADERRSVRTLSGGETFLVSLALALALADQLAGLSVHGAVRLESIFLDEGFGTLDPETLQMVAAVIHELGSQGRTVGLVTHVRELAEQVPVRFEIRKGPTTAAVERIEA